MFSAASQPLDPDGTVFRLRFTAMIWWVITFPVFGFFFCIIWSLVFHFEYTVATDCGVSARLPSTWVKARSGDGDKLESENRRRKWGDGKRGEGWGGSQRSGGLGKVGPSLPRVAEGRRGCREPRGCGRREG